MTSPLLLRVHFLSKFFFAPSTKSFKEASDLTCAYAPKHLPHYAMDKLSESLIPTRGSARVDQLFDLLFERSASMDQEILSQERLNLRVTRFAILEMPLTNTNRMIHPCQTHSDYLWKSSLSADSKRA